MVPLHRDTNFRALRAGDGVVIDLVGEPGTVAVSEYVGEKRTKDTDAETDMPQPRGAVTLTSSLTFP